MDKLKSNLLFEQLEPIPGRLLFFLIFFYKTLIHSHQLEGGGRLPMKVELPSAYRYDHRIPQEDIL